MKITKCFRFDKFETFASLKNEKIQAYLNFDVAFELRAYLLRVTAAAGCGFNISAAIYRWNN